MNEICKMCKQQKNIKETGRGIGYCWECKQKWNPEIPQIGFGVKKLLANQSLSTLNPDDL